ncbi:unnamed protein product, partial [Didymodactylos carnosus]
MDDDHIDKDSDSDSISIASDVEVHHTDLVNDDFIRLNLNHDDNNSEDEIENLTSFNNGEVIYIDPTSPSSTFVDSTTTDISIKHKRRQWNLIEKMKIISELNKGASLHTLELEFSCTRKMIREWKRNENQYIKLLKDSAKNRKRKRIDGAGAKLTCYDLDEHLITWYRSKRGLDQEGHEVSKEKVTFKAMIRQAQRHRLSLQKPVRKQKVSRSEAHILLDKFYSYLRRSSQLGPERGPMGCFTEADTCNMDESPLNLWGDQSRRCINDMNTKNEIEGHLDDKRFATVMLCVFPDNNNRVQPVLLFRGKGKVAVTEQKHYSPHVKVFFTPKAFINIPATKKYMDWWLDKVKD